MSSRQRRSTILERARRKLEASAVPSPQQGQLQETWVKVGGRLYERSSFRGQDWTEVARFNSRIVPNGDRIIRRRFPKEVVISLSSSCPTQVKSRSARSKPISSQVCRIAGRAHVSYHGNVSEHMVAHRCNNLLRHPPRSYLLGRRHGPQTNR